MWLKVHVRHNENITVLKISYCTIFVHTMRFKKSYKGKECKIPRGFELGTCISVTYVKNFCVCHLNM